MLIKENCRIVLEANKVTRKCFASLADFMAYYSISQQPPVDTPTTPDLYRPRISETRENTISLQRAFPFKEFPPNKSPDKHVSLFKSPNLFRSSASDGAGS